MGLIIYWYILPGLPFVCLGLFGAFRANQFSLRPFVGATIGALVAVSVPYGSLWLASVTYKGGGANIGLGLLLLAFPVYLPFAIFGGWRIGKSKSSEIESKST